MFDAAFTKLIRAAAPRWFIKTVTMNKTKLLAMARAGESRPTHATKIGHLLSSYSQPGGSSFDADFARKIRILAPYWFVDTTARNKTELLRMARAGKPRPKRPHRLVDVLSNYVRHDAGFARKIKALAPYWFIDSTIAANKRALLAMARAGKPRPKYITAIGRRLTAYTRPAQHLFDSNFTRRIKAAAPSWFLRMDKAASRERKIL